jgi:hypothetical protein
MDLYGSFGAMAVNRLNQLEMARDDTLSIYSELARKGSASGMHICGLYDDEAGAALGALSVIIEHRLCDCTRIAGKHPYDRRHYHAILECQVPNPAGCE